MSQFHVSMTCTCGDPQCQGTRYSEPLDLVSALRIAHFLSHECHMSTQAMPTTRSVTRLITDPTHRLRLTPALLAAGRGTEPIRPLPQELEESSATVPPGTPPAGEAPPAAAKSSGVAGFLAGLLGLGGPF